MTLEINQVYQGDCLELMKQLPDKSINLVLTDPPYNIGKADWDKIPNYVEWLGSVFLECQRVLKDNGSFYFFHNDFKQMAELQCWINKNTSLVFKSLITISKEDNNYIKDLYGTQDHFRNFLNLTEYALFYVNSGGVYTEWDKTGLEKVKLDVNNFVPLRKYFYDILVYIGKKSGKEVNNDLGHRRAEHCFYVMPKKSVIEEIGQKADHCFSYGSTQWDLPTEETYKEIADKYNLKQWENFREYESLRLEYESLRLEYESLRLEYESLRLEYESLRYVFNFKDGRENLLKYAFRDCNAKHPTKKPVQLMKDLILCSSNSGDLILDCFAGSGTTAVACIYTGRNYIIMEKEADYIEICKTRIKDAKDKMTFFDTQEII